MANTWGHVYASSSDLIVTLICVCWNPGLSRKYVQSLCIKCIFKIMPAIGGAQFLGAPSCVPVWSKATILRPRSLYIMVASLWQHPSRSYSLGSANIHLSRPPVLSSSFPTFWSWWQEFCHPGLSFREPKAASTLGPFGDLGVLLQTSILQLLPGGHFRENQSLLVPLILFPSLHQRTPWDDGGKSACSSDCPPWPKLPALSTGLQSQNVRTPVLPDASHYRLWSEGSPAPGSGEVNLCKINKQ